MGSTFFCTFWTISVCVLQCAFRGNTEYIELHIKYERTQNDQIRPNAAPPKKKTKKSQYYY